MIFSNIVILGALFSILIICNSPFSPKESYLKKKHIDLLIYKRRHLVKQKISPLEFETFLVALNLKALHTSLRSKDSLSS